MIAYQEVSEHTDTFLPTLFKVRILFSPNFFPKKEEKTSHFFVLNIEDREEHVFFLYNVYIRRIRNDRQMS